MKTESTFMKILFLSIKVEIINEHKGIAEIIQLRVNLNMEWAVTKPLKCLERYVTKTLSINQPLECSLLHFFFYFISWDIPLP